MTEIKFVQIYYANGEVVVKEVSELKPYIYVRDYTSPSLEPDKYYKIHTRTLTIPTISGIDKITGYGLYQSEKWLHISKPEEA